MSGKSISVYCVDVPEVLTFEERELLFSTENDCDRKLNAVLISKQNENINIHETKTLPIMLDCSRGSQVPPDGGWGWYVLLGGFANFILATLPLLAYGILFAPLWKRFDATSTMIAWIFNAEICIYNVVTITVGPLCEEFGWRSIAFIGGLFNGFSFILSAFAPNPQFLFFSFSTLGGIGGSFGISASVFIVSKYFLKRRGFALGMMTLGVCGGSFIGPLLSNFLISNYDFKGACLIFGAILFNQCVASALFQPIKDRLILYSEEDRVVKCSNEQGTFFEADNINDEDDGIKEFRLKIMGGKLPRRLSETSQYSSGMTEQSAIAFTSVVQNDKEAKCHSKWSFLFCVDVIMKILRAIFENLKSLHSIRVIFISVSAGCLLMGFLNFQMWIPFVVRDAGHTLEMSAWCLSSAAITNTVARIIISVTVDCQWFNIRGAYITGILIIAVSIAIFPLRKEFTYLIICASVWGFGLGISMSLYSTTIINVVGAELFPIVYGICSLFTAIMFIVVGPILGMIQDATSNYRSVLWILATITFLGVPLWLMMPLATKLDEKREMRSVNLQGRNTLYNLK